MIFRSETGWFCHTAFLLALWQGISTSFLDNFLCHLRCAEFDLSDCHSVFKYTDTKVADVHIVATADLVDKANTLCYCAAETDVLRCISVLLLLALQRLK